MSQRDLFLLVFSIFTLASCYSGRIRHIGKQTHEQDTSTICILPAEFIFFDTAFSDAELAGRYVYIINYGYAGISLEIDSAGRFTEKKWSDVPSILDNKIHGKWKRNGVEMQFSYNRIFQRKNKMTVIKVGHLFFLTPESKLAELLTLLTVHKKTIQEVNKNWKGDNVDSYKNRTWYFLKKVCFIKLK